MRYSPAAKCLIAYLLLAPAGAALAQSPSGPDEHPLLPPGEGRDLMIKTCSECHAPDRAAYERRDLEDFQALMVEMQGNGLQAPEEDLDKIAAYLAKAFPPSLPLPKKPAP